MRDSVCCWRVVLKMLKYFEIMLDIFDFSHVKNLSGQFKKIFHEWPNGISRPGL